MNPRRRLQAVVKAYDVRGAAPDVLDESLAFALGVGFAEELQIAAGDKAAVVGRDMRHTSPALAAAVIGGITASGADVVDIGLASTDLLYFASGEWELPGVMVTASHNPAGYNGLKLCRARARPISRDTGLAAIAERAAKVLTDEPSQRRCGSVHSRDALPGYADRLTELVGVGPRADGRPLRVVVDAGSGMAGHVVPAVFSRLDVELLPLYFELDGSFPHHEANPLEPENLVDLVQAVRRHEADLGLAFDGDADRCFVVDERGELVTPSAVTSMIAERLLQRHPGATVLHNAICSRAVPELITEHGGTAVRTPVGHSLIKAEMARTGAVFGGEHSGHYYFADFYLADSGMLAALHVMATLVAAAPDTALSELTGRYQRYVASGEVNRRVGDVAAVTGRVREDFAGQPVTFDTLDGLTVRHEQWWFNMRGSQTEPLLRLNVEATDEATMTGVRDQVLALIEEQTAGRG